MSLEKLFIVFAGPNGSGKSTLAAKFSEHNPEMVYIGADYIAKNAFFDVEDDDKRSELAMYKAEELLEISLHRGYQTGFETVLSSDYKWRFFDIAHKNKYTIISFFITTKSADMNWERVKKRVNEGGHPVEEGKVRARYTRSLERFSKLVAMSDICLAYDNSGTEPLLVFKKVCSEIELVDQIGDYPWLAQNLDAILNKSEYTKLSLIPLKKLQRYTTKFVKINKGK